MKREINVTDYANQITSAIPHGVLVTTRNGDRVNCMTIGWGTIGTMWSMPMMMIYIREGRFTRQMLDASGEFTLNVPFGETKTQKITAYCGSRSGRNTDKVKDLGLTLVESDLVKAPGIAELPLTLECRVLYKQLLDKNAVPEDVRKSMYPEDVDSSNPMANRDYHFCYYGKILKAYIIE